MDKVSLSDRPDVVDLNPASYQGDPVVGIVPDIGG